MKRPTDIAPPPPPRGRDVSDWEGDVDLLFRAVLDRPSDPEARLAFAGVLAAGEASVDGIIAELRASEEAKARQFHAFADLLLSALYEAILRRPIDGPAREYWLNAIGNGTSLADVIVSIERSVEARVWQLRDIARLDGVAAILLAEGQARAANKNG